MKIKWNRLLAIYFSLILLISIIVYAIPYLMGVLEKTYVAEHGSIDVVDNVHAYIIREEKVYVAEKAGDLKRLAEEGKLVKAGTSIVEMTGTNKEQQDSRYTSILTNLGDGVIKTSDGTTKVAGYASYYVDGAEAKLTVENLDKIRKKDFETLSGEKMSDTASGVIAEGEPIFKIATNSKWYLVYYLDNKDAKKYYEGKNLNVKMDEKDVPMKVEAIKKGKNLSKITLSCKYYFKNFLKMRDLDTSVTFASSEGLIIKNSSIVEKNGKQGVIIKNKLGKHLFCPISILADNGEECVVYADLYVDEKGNFVETISTYDEVLTQPTDKDIKKTDEH